MIERIRSIVSTYMGMSAITHSIICWDSCFRNFFHLLGSLAEQNYDLSTVEVIFVEQRSKTGAAEWAAQNGVPSVQETVDALDGKLNVRLYHLNQSAEHVYHPGALLNFGLRKSRGQFLSTMDVDILVPPIFLQMLDQAHVTSPRVVNMHRYMADAPCEVSTEEWTRQTLDYWKVFALCSDVKHRIPLRVYNYAPLLSAHRDHWEAIGYYDDHAIFSTPYTFFGRDVATRFGCLLGDVEHVLPIACVHPWHPTPIDRQKDSFQILHQCQTKLIEWSKNNGVAPLYARRPIANEIYREHGVEIDAAIALAEAEIYGQRHTPGMLSASSSGGIS